MLSDVAGIAFGPEARVIHPKSLPDTSVEGVCVLALGEGYGGEIRIPAPGTRRNFFVDWILAKLTPDKDVAEFVAVEVQSIDTNNSNRAAIELMKRGQRGVVQTGASPNWENVNKRILPQLIYKGHVLRREPKCKQGLFFVCPTPVYNNIRERIGDELVKYPLQAGAITFVWYDSGRASDPEDSLRLAGTLTTTTDILAQAFSGTRNMPSPEAYQEAIEQVVRRAKGGRVKKGRDYARLDFGED